MAVEKKKKYWVDQKKRKRFQAPLFRKVITYEVDTKEAEKFLKKNRRLPDHVYLVEDKHESQ